MYGGGGVGLMGKVSGTVFRKGGKVLGVIPVALQPVELSGESVGEVRVVADMHERKALMAKEADRSSHCRVGLGLSRNSWR